MDVLPGFRPGAVYGIEPVMRLIAESLRFAGNRCLVQADHVAALSRCTSPVEIQQRNAAFLAQILSDYRQEASRLSDICFNGRADSGQPSR
ncbi:MAG: hypothetical protein K2X71_06665 [Methylobacterium sp.]|uniref:hypothetical protein n=1 Tax=Methylobacterium sp. TaxID=409 RepID=UPI002587EF61|nr:hypothetical protein [Methylobacterium sp.]MBY0295707.1 hypothetical protein [Methylobacterium sp.]